MYATGINGISLITKNIKHLINKWIIVFTLVATPLHTGIPEAVKSSNFTAEQQKHIKYFMLNGGYDYNRLALPDKILMLLLKAKLKIKRDPSADERGMLTSNTHPIDYTDEKLIAPIVNAIYNNI